MKLQTRNKMKRVIPFVLAMAMIFGVIASAVGTMAAGATEITSSSSDEPQKPDLGITVKDGDQYSLNDRSGALTFAIKNNRNESIKVIGISATPNNTSDLYTCAVGTNLNIDINSGKERNFILNLAFDNLDQGTYTVDLEIVYKVGDVEHTENLQVTFSIKASSIDLSKDDANFVSVKQSIPNFRYSDGRETIDFKLQNDTDHKVEIESIDSISTSSNSFTVLENEITYKETSSSSTVAKNIEIDAESPSDGSFRVKIDIDREIKKGMYWIEIVFNYADGNREKIRIYFEITRQKPESGTETEESDVIFKPQMDIHVPKDSIVEIKSGDEFLLTVLLDYDRHVINEEISSLTVTAESFDVSDGMETRILDKINDKYTGSEAYQKAAFYRLQTKKDLKSGRYPITMKVDYVDEDGKEYSVTNRYTVYVIGEDEDEDGKKTSSATPFIIIEEYDYGGGNVVAGDSFELKFTFFNTSTYIPLENILVTVTTPEDLSLTSSSNTFFIPALAPQERMSKTIQVTAKAAAKPSSPSISIKFKYEYLEPSRDDSEDKRVSDKTSEENIAVPLIQKDRFEVGDVEPPMQMFVGEENSISVEFVNKGTNDVRNITASITGNIQNPGQSQYIGNLISGEQNSADFYITAMEPGEVKGQIVISYEDSNGDTKEIKKDYTVPVIQMTFPDEDEMAGMMDPSLMGEEENKGLPFLAWVGIVAGALVVAAVILVIVLKKVKKKKQEAEDETL